MDLDKTDPDGPLEMSRSRTLPSTMSAEFALDDKEENGKEERNAISDFDCVTAELVRLGATRHGRQSVRNTTTSNLWAHIISIGQNC